MSEYLGIRLSMLDALQRYQSTAGHEKLSEPQQVHLLQTLIRQACHDDNLLGARKDIIGNAWADLLASRPPHAVMQFVENPDIKTMTTHLPPLKPMVGHMNDAQAIGLVAVNYSTLKPLVTGFEDIAQKTGMIDYRHGDSLSDEITKHAMAAGQNQQHTTEQPESAKTIKQLFDSHNGAVRPTDLGLQGHHAQSGAHHTSAPAQATPFAVNHTAQKTR
jgi:hypothetical protein